MVHVSTLYPAQTWPREFKMATSLRIPFFFDHPTACVACRLFEKLICSNERSTKFESLYHGQKYLAEENGKMVALKISPKIESLYGLGRQATNLQLLQGSHLDNFPLKTLKLSWVAFHSLTFQLKCLDFQFNQYNKLAPVLSRFCNGLCYTHTTPRQNVCACVIFGHFRFTPISFPEPTCL